MENTSSWNGSGCHKSLFKIPLFCFIAVRAATCLSHHSPLPNIIARWQLLLLLVQKPGSYVAVTINTSLRILTIL